MRTVKLVACDEFFLQEEPIGKMITFSGEDYLKRIARLSDKMREHHLDYMVIYGDREHFMNIDYLSGYDPRFEEALYIIDRGGHVSLLTGPEGEGYARKIEYPVSVTLYPDFGLQGQPRDQMKELPEIFAAAGISAASRVGVAGYKYLTDKQGAVRRDRFDIPGYILEDLKSTAGEVENYTDLFTGLPDGLRMSVTSAKEIAVIDYMNANVSNVFLRLFKGMKAGITELELSGVQAYMHPANVHPMICFGERSSDIGLKSPEDVRLNVGDIASICYSLRYSLTCRSAIAAYDKSDCHPELAREFENFYGEYYRAVAAWYGAVRIGAETGHIYDAVHQIVGDEYYGLLLNPGHNISSDEWSNSSFAKGSTVKLHSGSHLQCDIIACGTNPVKKAICEDGIILADESLRAELKLGYPEVYAKIQKRRRMMSEVLGINVSEDVLPMSNLCGVYWPFMLDKTRVFAVC